jgi:hypothetical protein
MTITTDGVIRSSAVAARCWCGEEHQTDQQPG